MESSENTTDRENYLTAYIQKQENLLLEHMRKNIDLDIKIHAYVSSYNEIKEQLVESNDKLQNQIEISNQAAKGVEAVSIEKKQLQDKEVGYQNRVRDLEAALVNKTNEHRVTAEELQTLRNNMNNSARETEELRREFQRQTEELNTLYKENEELKLKLPQPKKAVVKKAEPEKAAILPPDEF